MLPGLTFEQIPVSVIIPCFRCRGTIVRALDSVMNQTMLPIEIILVDDFSGDGTYDFLIELSLRYKKDWIKVFQLQQNSGPGSARNFGWDRAKGDYVAFLDSDDSWHKNKLEVQYGWMRGMPEVVMSGHRTQLLQEQQSIPLSFEPPNAERVYAKKLLLVNQFPTRSVMLKRSLDLRFFPGKRHSEDYLLWLKIVLSGHPSWVLSSVLTFSYKPDFGGSGLSGQLWMHEMGELDTYRRIMNDGLISKLTWLFISIFSYLKYLRRVLLKPN